MWAVGARVGLREPPPEPMEVKEEPEGEPPKPGEDEEAAKRGAGSGVRAGGGRE